MVLLSFYFVLNCATVLYCVWSWWCSPKISEEEQQRREGPNMIRLLPPARMFAKSNVLRMSAVSKDAREHFFCEFTMTGTNAVSQESIRAILEAEVEQASARYREIAAECRALMDNVPPERSDLAVLFPLTALEHEKSAAIKALCNAVRRYNDFVLRGKVPEDLVNSPEN
jgi:hypothetical protein